MTARRAREKVGIVAIGLLAGVGLAMALAVGLGGPAPQPSPSGGSVAPAAPVVFYEVLDADSSLLLARSLNGRDLARVVGRRPSFDYGRTWSVDPAGDLALARFEDSSGASRLEAVDTASGASRWVIDMPTVDIGVGIWSDDGTRFAATTQPDDETKRQAVIVDIAAGTIALVPIPPVPSPQGFDADGALVLRERLEDAQGQVLGWRFLRVDPAAATIEQLRVPPAIGPNTYGAEDVDPDVGIGLDSTPRDDGAGTDLRAWPLGGGKPRTVATLESVDTIAMDPAGRLVAIGVGQESVVLVNLDGHSSPIWAGQGRGDLAWSAGGDYLGVNSWDQVSHIDVIERASGRRVSLPMPSGIAQAALVRIVGGLPLPETALPAVEPTPSPTPAPSGPDLAAGGALIAGWIDEADGHSIAHVERRIATSQGGMRTTATMDPVDLGETSALTGNDDLSEGPRLSLEPRPGGPDILVWVDGPAGSRAWLWAPDGLRRDLPIPAGWPVRTSDVTWRPDGLALAAAAYETDAGGNTKSGFVIGVLGGKTKWLDTPPDYDQLEGWWSARELLVGHVICTEGCPGRYSYSASVDVATGKLRPLGQKDRGRLPIHIWYADDTGRSIFLSAVSADTANDIRLDWPASIPVADKPEVIGWASHGAALLVAVRTSTGSTVYRIDDPIGRATAGHLVDPAPVAIGSLPGSGDVSSVSPDGAWARLSDRTGAVRLVQLATGRAWPLDGSASAVWQAGD